METIKLIDENLVGQPGLSRYVDPKTGWEREPENYDIGIYVDRMCFTQPIDNTKVNCAWLNDPDGYCKVWREFQTEHKPKYWVVWPHSVSKDWCERITGNL